MTQKSIWRQEEQRYRKVSQPSVEKECSWPLLCPCGIQCGCGALGGGRATLSEGLLSPRKS